MLNEIYAAAELAHVQSERALAEQHKLVLVQEMLEAERALGETERSALVRSLVTRSITALRDTRLNT